MEKKKLNISLSVLIKHNMCSTDTHVGLYRTTNVSIVRIDSTRGKILNPGRRIAVSSRYVQQPVSAQTAVLLEDKTQQKKWQWLAWADRNQ